MVSRLTVALLACLLLIAPASATAAVDLSLEGAVFTETSGSLDDVVAPGDRVDVEPTIRSATPLTNATAQLDSATTGVEVERATADLGDVAAGATATGTPFDVVLESTGLTCGARVEFALKVTADEGEATLPFVMPTGTAGPVREFSDAPGIALADDGTTEVAIEVPTNQNGLVKRAEIRIGRLTHPRVGDLRIELVAPDGTSVMLVDGRGGSGADLVDTVFADDGAPVASASAPFTGTYAPEQPLSVLEGRRLDGTWSLRIQDTAAGESGTLDAWQLDARRAYCAGMPRARLAMTSGGAAVTQVEPGTTVDFDASGSRDADGTIRSYEFDLDGDGTYEIGPTTDATQSRTYSAPGRIRPRLRVLDNSGLSDTEELLLPVTVAPDAAISASTTTPLSNTSVTFDASGSTDADGTIVRYEWDLDGDESFETDTQGTPVKTTSFPTSGPRTVRVRVTDDLGGRTVAAVAVTVENRAPTAAISVPALVQTDTPTELSGGPSTDPDGQIRHYDWDLDGNGSFETLMGDEPLLSRTLTTGGSVTVGLRVTDDRNATAVTSVTFTVLEAPDVVLTATPATVSLRRTVTLDATQTADADSDDALLTFAWDLDGDGDFEIAPGAARTRTVSFAQPGVRALGVRVVDAEGATTVKTVSVRALNRLPQAQVSASASTVERGTSVTLDASGSSDPDGTIKRYWWDLDGDGVFERDGGTAPTVATTFPSAGTTRVSVRVTDDDDAWGTAGVTVTAVEPATLGEPGKPAQDVSATPKPDEARAADAAVAPPSGPVSTPAVADPRAGVEAPAVAGYMATLGGPPIQSAKNAIRRGLTLSCAAVADGRCIVEAFLSPRDAARLGFGRKRVKVGRVTTLLKAGKTAQVTLTFTRTAKARLKRTRSVSLLVTGIARDWKGRSAPLSRVVLLRR